jgi:ferredoxin--NADP+ reductase
MVNIINERVTEVHHWNETLFSFKTTRRQSLRFENGHFIMLGLKKEGHNLMRAYSIASANHEDQLEFLSIKVPHGELTSILQKIEVGDEILLSTKPTGTLITGHLLPGKHLYLLGTGTGLAPFMSIIRDPDIYEQYEKIILVHGVRYISELAYMNYIQEELGENEYFGESVQDKLIYYPTVTREPFTNTGRITDLISNKKIFSDTGLPEPTVDQDRFMLCGSPEMLKDTSEILNGLGFEESKRGKQAGYVIERAFVEK